MVGKNNRVAGVATTFVGVALAGVCLAQTVDPNNAAAVKAWQTSNNIQEKVGGLGWQAFTAQPDGLYLRGVISARGADGQAVVGVRIEHFTPQPVPGSSPSLSEIDAFAVDCVTAGGRIKATTISSYPQHNLAGDKKDAPVQDNWAPASSIDFLTAEVTAACRATGGGGARAGAQTAALPSAPFNIADNNAGINWIRNNKVDQGGSAATPDWPLLGFSAGGAMFRSAKEDTTKGSRATPRYLLRQEFYGPVTLPAGGTALSKSIDYDINCSRGQVRQVQSTMYSDRNLSGTATVTPINGSFVPVAQDPVMKSAFDDICLQADKDLDAGAGKFQHK